MGQKLDDIGLLGISAKEALAERGMGDDVLYGTPAGNSLHAHNLLYLLERHYPHLLEGRFLDLFCGKGYLLQGIAQDKPELEVYGVDGNAQAIADAHTICPTGHFIEQICPPLPYDSDFFHIVCANNIMDYADTQRIVGNVFPETFSFSELSAEIYRVLLPEGIYVPGDELLPREWVILNAQGFLQQEKTGRMVFEKK